MDHWTTFIPDDESSRRFVARVEKMTGGEAMRYCALFKVCQEIVGENGDASIARIFFTEDLDRQKVADEPTKIVEPKVAPVLYTVDTIHELLSPYMPEKTMGTMSRNYIEVIETRLRQIRNDIKWAHVSGSARIKAAHSFMCEKKVFDNIASALEDGRLKIANSTLLADVQKMVAQGVHRGVVLRGRIEEIEQAAKSPYLKPTPKPVHKRKKHKKKTKPAWEVWMASG